MAAAAGFGPPHWGERKLGEASGRNSGTWSNCAQGGCGTERAVRPNYAMGIMAP